MTAVARVFARLGEKKNRGRARIKFLVAKLGIEEFRRLVEAEKKTIPHDPRHTAFLDDMPRTQGEPARLPAPLPPGEHSDAFKTWYATNIYHQRQSGYSLVTIALPLGDMTSNQTRALVDIARTYSGDNIRTTVEQNMVLRFVSSEDLPALYEALDAAGLASPGAGSIIDVTSCPGTDTCKPGIAASRGLAGEFRDRLGAKAASLPRGAMKSTVERMNFSFISSTTDSGMSRLEGFKMSRRTVSICSVTFASSVIPPAIEPSFGRKCTSSSDCGTCVRKLWMGLSSLNPMKRSSVAPCVSNATAALTDWSCSISHVPSRAMGLSVVSPGSTFSIGR